MKFFSIKYTVALFAAVMTTACGGGKAPSHYRTIDGVAWHTTFHIVYDSPRDLSADVMAIIDSVERSLSPFLPDSRIAAINRGESQTADSMIIRVFDTSKRINLLTQGRFDPTLSPLIDLWGFGKGPVETIPSDAEIDSCLQWVGIDQCSRTGLTIEKKSPATQFNFSAITKGFGVDCVGEALARAGCGNYLVEIGGEIVARGKNPGGNIWRVSVDLPTDTLRPGQGAAATLELDGCGVATSGNYRNYRTVDGRKAGHTINPATGRPVQTSILSATVIAPTAMEADALATSLMVGDTADARALFSRLPQGYKALLVLQGDSSDYVVEEIE